MVSGKVKSRVKLKQTKRKKWKKGHSSDSNPEGKRFREAAKNRFFNYNTGPSTLTLEALTIHNEGVDEDVDIDKAGSIGSGLSDAKTFQTWASNLTECTNSAFSSVHRYWASNSAMHKEILAVLAAVTEVIKTQGGKETETEYFAALMTSLETIDTEDSLAAVAYLLSLVIKRVPVAVLKSKFSDIAKVFMGLLADHSGSDSTSLLKSLLVCVSSLLRVQDQVVWSDSSTLQVYRGLLSFTTHHKPKVRKAAHHAVCSVLKGSSFMTQGDPPPSHPAASATAKHCIQHIEECGGTGEASDTLHILGLLKDILHVFPHNSLKSTCETVLRVMTLSNVMVTSVVMQALYGMFCNQPKSSSLPAELNAQIITALYDFQPGENDVQPMNAWLAVMEKALVNLARLNANLCISHLPRIFTAAMSCLLSEKSHIGVTAVGIMKVLLQEIVAPNSDRFEVMLKSAPSSNLTEKLVKIIEGGLSYQYHASWNLVLQVLAKLFEVLGKQCHSVMRKCLLSLADLRDSYKFPQKAELDHTVGMAVRTMGPRVVLEAIPLQITGEEDDLDFPRSWLLPLLRDSIRETELGFFASHFLPLAAKLRNKSLQHAQEKRQVESKTYDALQMQIWSLLPGFCNNPIDLPQSFKGIAKVLGSAISDRPDLRGDVMASLRKLILQNLDNDENRAELARFSKNFLPILFNLFTTAPESEKDMSRLAVLETIRCYIQISDEQLVNSFFDKCMSKLEDEDAKPFLRHSLLDLVIGMVPYVTEDRIQKMMAAMSSWIDSTDKTVQKKSYRILEEVCAGKSENSRNFVFKNIPVLQKMLLKSLSSSSPPAKAPRLRCLIHILKQLQESEEDFIIAVVPEAILCVKEVATKARAAAFGLLIEIGTALLRWSQDRSEKDVVHQYLQLLMAGLAGSPHMVSATVLALSRTLYHFRDKVGSQSLDMLVDHACLLLTSKAREVVFSALGFVKALLAVFKDVELAAYLNKLVSSLVSMKEENRHHFRFKAKEVFARLIKKFGYETVHEMVPVSHHKMLLNIKKTQERAAKNKHAKGDHEEDEDDDGFRNAAKPENIDDLLQDIDSDLEEEKKPKAKKIKSQKGNQTWLMEGGGDEFIDFLDPTVSKKVLATKPEIASTSKKLSKEAGFKMAADGRMIITEEGNEEKTSKTKEKKNKSTEEEAMEDLDDLLDAMDGYKGKKSGKKRKFEGVDEDMDEAPAKYKAGGSGIHRPLDGSKAEKKGDYGSEYRSTKGGGDVKRVGKPDPYAYVPLEMKFLNKRKSSKMKGRFKNLVKGAKKGAAMGSRAKGKKKGK
ncbi:RRP12-like protein isoform X2 [Lingula anatina]|uniref:RRP12-like protein isoform X2 n=1 Tax=Lingula anatina TaxID=7574 RepID=A0A1S3H3U4_LINAN|nr:RRP12-like protein isoform X2 [Lingula anatina]|eukprot:XP_013379809.1 RRP12-like protein isoform X2 [Lingula anatina]